jgi:hypothetical protein
MRVRIESLFPEFLVNIVFRQPPGGFFGAICLELN